MHILILNRGGGVDTSDANATKDQILDGYTAYVNEIKIMGTMPNIGAISYELPANGVYNIPYGFHNGSGRVYQSLTTQGGSTAVPGTSNKVVVPAGRYVTAAVYAAGDGNLTAPNIKENVDIFGVVGSFVGTNCRDANAGAGQILTGYTGYVNQVKVTGTMPNRGAVDVTLAGNGTYIIPEGYHNGSGRVHQALNKRPAATITPSASDQVAVNAGWYTTGEVWMAGDGSLAAENIKSNVTIFGVTGTFTG